MFGSERLHVQTRMALYPAINCEHYTYKKHANWFCCTQGADDRMQEEPRHEKATERQEVPVKVKESIHAGEKQENEKTPTRKDSSLEPDLNEGKSGRVGMISKTRAMFEVQDPEYLSVEDFEFKKEGIIKDDRVFMVKNKQGNDVWMLEKDYVILKVKFNAMKADNNNDEEL
jgi:hypothetical protein